LLFYTGSGPPEAPVVVFVHGLGCDSHDWDWQIPSLESDHRTIAVDLAGHGRSGPRRSGYRPRDFAHDLALIAESCGWDQFHIVGHSLGAAVADVLAVERPDLVRSLVLVDPAIELPVPDLAAARQVAANVREQGPEALVADYRADGAAEPAWLKTWRVRRLLSTAPEVLADAYVGLREGPLDTAKPMDWPSLLCSRRCPVLALHRDARLAAVEATTFAHPSSRCEVWEGCGHWLQVEQAERFNDLVRGWLEGPEGRPTGPARLLARGRGLPPSPHRSH
jgi:pimeloyl-ACP methyl ester carboxylesterase